MTRRTRPLTTAFIGCVLVLAGCSPTPPPAVYPSEDPKIPVPPIPAPLNGEKFIADPCTAITVQQLNDIGFSGGTQERDPGGTRCDIKFGNLARVGAWRSQGFRETLRFLYTEHAKGHGAGINNRWDELIVNGYPGVIVRVEDNIPSHKDKGPVSCTLALGIDNDTLIYLNAATYESPQAGPWRYDPCGATKKVAELAITNLRS
ncbi:DUF3558 domain-containing protein [Amycolatopsis samaneae]|uniref:DUF3558 domain-containing protein n=1 Tax=Amycolatopsis samaneae TaxID=664691 RepID=A0ABW5G785_9PSEU